MLKTWRETENERLKNWDRATVMETKRDGDGEQGRGGNTHTERWESGRRFRWEAWKDT